MTVLEIKGALLAVATSLITLIATFTAAGVYRNYFATETQSGNELVKPEKLTAEGRRFFLQSCAHCHGRDADGGEDAPSLLNLQISGAHMALVIQSGIKGEMPSFAKKYGEPETVALVAYLKTLH
ncbi:MAG TPA: c-type cytochrome [Chthoniobacterales bacterium]|nr:c-type cytochrome [Chthoniobacterales bacterium]